MCYLRNNFWNQIFLNKESCEDIFLLIQLMKTENKKKVKKISILKQHSDHISSRKFDNADDVLVLIYKMQIKKSAKILYVNFLKYNS